MSDKESKAKRIAWLEAGGAYSVDLEFDDGWDAGVMWSEAAIGEWLMSDAGLEWIDKCWNEKCSKRSNVRDLAFVLAKRFLIGDWKL